MTSESTTPAARHAPAGESRPIPRTDGKGYRAAYYDVLGHRRWITAPTADEAAQRRADRLKLQNAGITPVSESESVYGLLSRWIAKVRPGTRTKRSRAGLKHSTWVRYDGLVRNHLRRYLSRVPALALTTAHVDEMIESLEAERYLSARSIEYVWTTLVAGLAWAVSKQLIPAEIEQNARRATLPAVERAGDVPPFSAARTRALLEAIASHRFASLFQIAATVGPRQGELLGARWSDVDWESRRLWIHSTLAWPAGLPVAERNKANRRRYVPLSPRSLRLLEEWRRVQAVERVEYLRRNPTAKWENDRPDHNFIWTSPYGNPARGTGTGGVTSQLKTALRHGGLPDADAWDFYTLRHHAASWMLAATNGNMFVVMRLLGHTSTIQLEKTYGHLIEHVPAETIRLAEHLLEGTVDAAGMITPAVSRSQRVTEVG